MPLKQVYWRIWYMKCAFAHKWVFPKYHLCYLNELTFNGNPFSFIKLLTIFCGVLISYLMVINSMYYEWIMNKANSNEPLMLLNMAYTYMESCFSHMSSQVCSSLVHSWLSFLLKGIWNSISHTWFKTIYCFIWVITFATVDLIKCLQ